MKKILFAIILIVILAITFAPKEAEAPVEAPSVKEVKVTEALEFKNNSSVYKLIGQVNSTEQIDVRAEVGGRIVELNVNVGDQLEVGQVIASFDNDQLNTRVQQAEGALRSAQANLASMTSGARAEDLQIIELQLSSAQQRLYQLQKGAREEEVTATKINIENTQKSLSDAEVILAKTKEKNQQDKKTIRSNTIYVIESASTIANKVMSVYLQGITLEGNNAADCRYNFISTASKSDDQGTKCIDAFFAENELNNLAEGLNNPYAIPSNLETELNQAEEYIKTIQTYIEVTFYVLDNAVGHLGNRSISPSELSGYKQSVLAAQAEVESVLNQINNQKQASITHTLNSDLSVVNAEAGMHELESRLGSLQQELKIKQTGATKEDLAIQKSLIDQLNLQLQIARTGARPEDVRAQQGMISQMNASLENAKLDKDKAVIRAPFRGRVINTFIEVGDYVNIGGVIATLVNAGSLEIVTYISNEEREFVNIGDTVEIETPHGYTSGAITEIAPSLDPITKKMKVTIQPSEITKKLTIGTNVRVKFARISDSIQIPLTAVKFKGTESYVLTIDEGSVAHEVSVILGNTYSDNIEIRSGLDDSTRIIEDARGIQNGEVVKVQ
ncbi:MAG: efflux RND transporter periplasmic adaptor subunit [Candidatus Peregrinibacteria bacterium]|nr:efflux RND transporter periplasmic adaptor subunit [Candidatus Peregrinibacteria bacterium]MDZ4245284.1 efflux RND transporter periplasmic adaptor subunit [Candidatus Gracilibacteria bacterium]